MKVILEIEMTDAKKDVLFKAMKENRPVDLCILFNAREAVVTDVECKREPLFSTSSGPIGYSQGKTIINMIGI